MKKILPILLVFPVWLSAQTPLFYAKIKEGTTTTTTDQIGPYAGTLTNMDATTDWVTGRNWIEFGLDFDNTNDRVTFGDNVDLTTATFTITAWIYPRSLGEGSFGRIVDKNNASATDGYAFQLNTTNRITIGAASTTANSNNNAITFRQWQHIAVSCNGTNASFFVNGTGVGSPAFTAVPIGNAVALNIGNRTNEDRTFDGIIDEVLIYNVALTEARVDSIYNSTLKKEKKPIWWGMQNKNFYVKAY